MKVSRVLPFLVLAWPILEIVAFIVVGGAIGILPTVLLVLAGVLVGVGLVRTSGLRLLSDIRADMAAGRPPRRDIVGGSMTAVAGLLLILPGFVSDAAGLLLLLPPLQRLAAERLASGFTVVTPHGGGPLRDGVVDLDPADFERRPDGTSPWRGGDLPPSNRT